MFRFILLSVGIVCLISACGSESDKTGSLADNCLTFCEQRIACDSSQRLDDVWKNECRSACKAERFDDDDIPLSQKLIGCAKYRSCTEFNSCVNQGGSVTDDQYGGFSDERQ